MFFDFSRYRYYVKVGATDMRCGAVGLAYRVREHMNLDVLSKSMFLFCSRDRSMLKVLVWDDGFWLMTKRLSGGTFRWPLTETVSGHLQLLHDGRARGFAEAILWHGGEAESAKEAFRTARAADRAALVRFLESL